MSAIIPSNQRNTGGVDRYHTSVKVEVASHNRPDKIILTPDVFAVSVGKTIKGEGRANVALTAARNYLNLLYPNDYVNIYFDIGDGEGWTRVFFGLVDRVEEEFKVGTDGQTNTSYHMIATDFTKVFNKVQVYFNPALANREDWRQEDFTQSNIGGITVLSRGVTVSGSPAEVIQNYILVMLGFGTQMVLPPSYRPSTSQQFRDSQSDFILRQFENPSLSRVLDTETIDALRSRLNQDSPPDTAEPPEDLEPLAQLALADEDEIVGEYSQDEVQARILAQLAMRRINPGATGPSFLLDILDIYSFIENLAIDGRSDILTVLDSQGDIMSILRSLSNEVVNELFFDLRAVNADGILSAGHAFSRDPDDWGGNIAEGGHPAGIQYVPAVVMREYPFSTIDSVDASNVPATVGGPGSERLYGMMTFGAIFSNEPGIAGRHVIQIPAIAVSSQVNGQPQGVARKHLDVAVLGEDDITSTRLGRSDEDHFNVFELFCNGVMGNSDERFMFADLLPLVSPIHIMRHGLRLRQTESRYVFFGESAVIAGQMQEQPTPEQEPEEEEEPVERDRRTDVEPPVRQEDTSFDISFLNSGNTKYGYRLDLQWRRAGAPGPRYWHFHNGIDIGTSVSVPVQRGTNITKRVIPVRAIADGEVVVSAPNGVYNMYGECVVIYHPQIEVDGRPIYSGYHHLAGRNTVVVGNEDNHRERADCSALGGGRFMRRPVHKGEIIGWMGNTFGTTTGDNPDPDAVFSGMTRPHLHFEIDFTFPPKGTAGNGGPIDYATADAYITSTHPGPVHPATGTPPTVTRPLSTDPFQFFLDRGINLQNLYSIGDGSVEEDAEGQTEQAAPEREEEQTEQEQSQRSTTEGGAHVDNIVIRNMVARWTLLQDHWYQHNLEYLNGTITCRPAPEIRVGYRLDIPERSMSFYVEGVQHSWQMTGKMTTTLQVTRGQPNNPYPVYVLPPVRGLADPSTQRRRADSRLAQYTVVSDPTAVRRALVLNAQSITPQGIDSRRSSLVHDNTVDIDYASNNLEAVIPAETTSQVYAAAAASNADPAVLAELLGISEEDVTTLLPDLAGTNGVGETDPSANFSDTELDRMYDEYGGDR